MPIALHDAPEDSEAASPPEKPVETDEQLMLAFAGGRSESFSELFRRYKQPLYGFFRRRLAESAHTQAEELTQETFLAVLRAASRYEPSALFRTYLYGIAFRILSAHRRKTAFRATFFGSTDVEREPGRPEALDAGLHIRQAVARLDRIDREALMLREFEQLSYAEIAEVLKLPLNTVRSRLFRARIALREILSAPPASVSANTRIEERP
jgi:RNA polymerase sigma-70 factor, ECF subfamily